jgi:two-component sensor histidine kinase
MARNWSIEVVSMWGLRESYSLRAHLIAFAAITLLPVLGLTGVLLARSAVLEHQQLESELARTASSLADVLDRDIERQITILRTLATMPSLAQGDWPAFYNSAKAAVAPKAYVILIDTSGRQLVNTFVPFGEAPAVTGDPDTLARILESKEPVISDLFVSLVTKKPVYNVSIPIAPNGSNVRYVLSLGQLTDDFLPLLQSQSRGPEWVSSFIDRQGIVLARSRDHAAFSGKVHQGFREDSQSIGHQVRRTTSLDGDDVLRAVVRSKMTGWLVTASVPVRIAEAPLRQSVWFWSALAGLSFVLALAGAGLFGRLLARPIEASMEAAAALGREAPIPALKSTLTEANALVAAQQRASEELARRATHQRLLLHELSHRVKNVLAVVQSLVQRTVSEGRSLTEARDVLTERLLALGRAQEVLMRTEWSGASLREIVEAELTPFSDRVTIEGPPLIVRGAMVQTFALVLHELATNALKHGSLSSGGTLAVSWSIADRDEAKRFTFKWEEKGGASVEPPTRKGFGRTLLEGAVAAETGVRPTLSFCASGFVYEIDAPLSSVGEPAIVS